jgi:anti-sigma factor RsiW
VACEGNTLLVHAYFDGELDLVRSLELEEHLKSCDRCAQELRSHETLRKSLREANLYEHTPESLEGRIRASLGTEAGTQAPYVASTRSTENVADSQKMLVQMPAQTPLRGRRRILEWTAIAAAVLVAVGLTFMFGPGLASRRHSEFLAQEIIASHIRSLQPGHLLDVQSTDQHTVKPWFNGRIDFSPPVRDLSDQGFPLIGGRLDYVDGRNVAALVYQRRKHLINVFIWPVGSGRAKPPASRSSYGYNLVSWQQNEMNFCAASDVNAGDLRQLAQLLQQP